MKLSKIALCCALLCADAALYAKPVPRPTGPSSQQLIAARQAGMALSAATLKSLYDNRTNAKSVKTLAFQARALAKWSEAMPALFAAGTMNLASNAKPQVWTNKPDFAAKAKVFADATSALSAAAFSDDGAAFDAALDRTADACQGCHETYRVTPPSPPKAG
jgi:cytochrome c556